VVGRQGVTLCQPALPALLPLLFSPAGQSGHITLLYFLYSFPLPASQASFPCFPSFTLLPCEKLGKAREERCKRTSYLEKSWGKHWWKGERRKVTWCKAG
jgi:hypothetical protein